MTLPEMLAELFELVEDEEITNNSCGHENPADSFEFCNVCFITNLYMNCSEDEDQFTEETTDAQRKTIDDLHKQFCDGEGWAA